MEKTFVLHISVDDEKVKQAEKITDLLGITSERVRALEGMENACVEEAKAKGETELNSFKAFLEAIDTPDFSDTDALVLMWMGWHSDRAHRAAEELQMKEALVHLFQGLLGGSGDEK